ncbi:phage tail sheath family protein [Yoonia sp. R2331]|uniref:phage tail sheath family protein n=1 Tax=Yoonia sp. R2331 TaxID=3237238 RepID=UPI0034E4646F
MPEQPLAPGVYIEEVPSGARTIGAVRTDVTGLIGHTETGPHLAPIRITSLADYEATFGGPATLAVDLDNGGGALTARLRKDSRFYLYHAVAQFFTNGGSVCVIVSVGDYGTPFAPVRKRRKVLRSGLKRLNERSDIRIVNIPDAVLLSRKNYARLLKSTLNHCETHGDRFALIDVHKGHKARDRDPDHDVITGRLTGFHTMVDGRDPSFGAAYYPWLAPAGTDPGFVLDTAGVAALQRVVEAAGPRPDATEMLSRASTQDPAELLAILNGLAVEYAEVAAALSQIKTQLRYAPPGGAVAGAMAQTDSTRGVWKAPAGVALRGVTGFATDLTEMDHAALTGGGAGPSVNSLRMISDIGPAIWGARTLGGDIDYRYVPVRRFALLLKSSLHKGLQWAVFEPNDANTWKSIRRDIDAFLNSLWREGAFQGSKASDAFFVRVGLGETMTQADLDNGRLICHVGFAPLRPAEFVVLTLNLSVA